MTGKSINISCQQDIFPTQTLSSEKLAQPGHQKRRKPPRLTTRERQIIAEHMRDLAAELPPYSWNVKTSLQIRSEADRYCQCGTQYFMLECDNDLTTYREALSCNSRICERCASRYARRMEPSIEHLFKPLLAKKVKGFGLFMLTLTTTTKRFDSNGPGRSDIKRFYKESGEFLRLHYGKYAAKFNGKGKVIEDQTRYTTETGPTGKRKKRRTPKLITKADGSQVEEWRRYRGAGYMASMELGSKSNMLHLHAVVYGPYIPYSKLRATWNKITTDSWNVDIRAVQNPKKATWYVLKYIIKPPLVDSYRTLAEYAYRIKGTRRIRTGGIFFNRVVRPDYEKLEKRCPYCSTWLKYRGQEKIDDPDNHPSQPLYPLLREVRKRGSPLPLPAGYYTAQDRLSIQLLADDMIAHPWLYGFES